MAGGLGESGLLPESGGESLPGGVEAFVVGEGDAHQGIPSTLRGVAFAVRAIVGGRERGVASHPQVPVAESAGEGRFQRGLQGLRLRVATRRGGQTARVPQ